MANRTASRRTTSRDVALLRQLYDDGQLVLAPEYQRSSVWPRAAKAFLIDSILRDRPIPPLFFLRRMSAQQGRTTYQVIDGQQRLRAVFDFLDNRFSLTESDGTAWAGNRYRNLSEDLRHRLLGYDFVIEELSGYDERDVEDIFVRVNRYVVALNAQELRHAREHGKFAEFVESVAGWDFWTRHRVFTPLQVRRMRPAEFSAELSILLAEGPQDKKSAVDIWYAKYRDDFPLAGELREQLASYLGWIEQALPKLSSTRFRKPVDLYALIGAVDLLSEQGGSLIVVEPKAAGRELTKFDSLSRRAKPTGDVARYLVAASRQTDNVKPRTTRISILQSILANAVK